jgi:hypothetical protein
VSVGHRDRVDLDETALVASRTACTGRGRGLGVAEIFRPDAVEGTLIAHIGGEPVGRHHIAKAGADCVEGALNFQGPRAWPARHVGRHVIELFGLARTVMIDRRRRDAGEISCPPATLIAGA